MCREFEPTTWVFEEYGACLRAEMPRQIACFSVGLCGAVPGRAPGQFVQHAVTAVPHSARSHPGSHKDPGPRSPQFETIVGPPQSALESKSGMQWFFCGTKVYSWLQLFWIQGAPGPDDVLDFALAAYFDEAS